MQPATNVEAMWAQASASRRWALAPEMVTYCVENPETSRCTDVCTIFSLNGTPDCSAHSHAYTPHTHTCTPAHTHTRQQHRQRVSQTIALVYLFVVHSTNCNSWPHMRKHKHACARTRTRLHTCARTVSHCLGELESQCANCVASKDACVIMAPFLLRRHHCGTRG